MAQTRKLLMFQRLRNSVIELFDICRSLESIAAIGAFEVLNSADDILPLNYSESSDVFTEEEKRSIVIFLEKLDLAAAVTPDDTWDANFLNTKAEWRELSRFSQLCFHVFMKRGIFSEISKSAPQT